uniref:Uncharacterized protein n=1 Tax=Spongospora subterranea TaxID=70186 RepID=A0A0H5QU51_9EUKA|eukprot:CRZ05414.1 hypothetical protein [Spongospora subterranea]
MIQIMICGKNGWDGKEQAFGIILLTSILIYNFFLINMVSGSAHVLVLCIIFIWITMFLSNTPKPIHLLQTQRWFEVSVYTQRRELYVLYIDGSCSSSVFINSNHAMISM